jgi:hypothetical protein
MNIKPKLYASSGTLEDITKLVSRFYCGTKVSLVEVSENMYDVYTEARGRQELMRVIKKKGRYRFEFIGG